MKKSWFKRIKKSEINTDKSGNSVLTKTEDFRLYAIRSDDEDDNLLGVVLLTEAQQNILNEATKSKGIHFTRK